MGDTGWKLGDCFGEHRRHVEKKKKKKKKKKTTRTHRNQHHAILIFANHFSQYEAIGGLSLHQGNTESHKKLEQKVIDPQVINEHFSFS